MITPRLELEELKLKAQMSSSDEFITVTPDLELKEILTRFEQEMARNNKTTDNSTTQELATSDD